MMRTFLPVIAAACAVFIQTAAAAPPARPSITTIANFVVKTDDLDAARKFYSGVLGYDVITQDGLAKIVEESMMPIGLGRKITDIVWFQSLLASGPVNIVRPSLGLNSLTKIKRIAAIAETHYVAIAAFHDGGPIGSMAGIHLNAALINAFAMEIPVPASDRDAAMRAEITSGLKETGDKRFAALMNRPGLGIDVNEQALDAFSEERT